MLAVRGGTSGLRQLTCRTRHCEAGQSLTFRENGGLSVDEVDLKKARALLRSGEYSKVQVADELEVSRHTLWRALSLEKTK
jgi:DNA invertase Pin-like site-specific DNA recombinase